MVLVGKPAPDFTAPAILGDNDIEPKFNLRNYLAGSYGVLFFYPLDFTFVCPSEILAFDKRAKEFSQRNTKVVAVSVDSHFTHLAWKSTPVNKGGLGMVGFPMVSDLKKEITRNYGILHDDSVALRGTFLIDRENIVRHQVVNDLPLGRNIDEAIRMVDALQFFEQNGEVCPAGWTPGKSGMKADASGVADYLSKHSNEL
jgi:peroxiredoxin 2/4